MPATGFVGYQHVWYRLDATHHLESTIGYGYALGGTSKPDDNRDLNQAFCNLIWNAGNNVAFGLEFQYGARRVASGNFGDDHRVMFVGEFQAIPSKYKTPTPVLRSSETIDGRGQSTRPIYSRRL
jgi:hypothetical protein